MKRITAGDPEESVAWESTRNLLIEGDNLEALKLLHTADELLAYRVARSLTGRPGRRMLKGTWAHRMRPRGEESE